MQGQQVVFISLLEALDSMVASCELRSFRLPDGEFLYERGPALRPENAHVQATSLTHQYTEPRPVVPANGSKGVQ
jgi:hypothetical protein